MKRLNYEQAYNESVGYDLLLNRPDYDEFFNPTSESMDRSREYLRTNTNEDLVNACLVAAKECQKIQATPEAQYTMETWREELDYVVWNMPFIDPERALVFYLSSIDNCKTREDLANTCIIGQPNLLQVDQEKGQAVTLAALASQDHKIIFDALENLDQHGDLFDALFVERLWSDPAVRQHAGRYPFLHNPHIRNLEKTHYEHSKS